MKYHRIRDLREDRDMSQTQVAKMLGMSQTGYSKYETGDWNHHLDKLLYNYNYFGAHSQYLLTYVDRRKEEFGGIWTAFKAHIQGQSGGGFPYVEGSFVDLNDPRDPLFVKKSLCRYNCGGQEITVYHIFAQIDLP